MGCSNSNAEEMKDKDSKVPDFISTISKSMVEMNIQGKSYSGVLNQIFQRW